MSKKLTITIAVAKKFLPKRLRLTYGFKDVLASVLEIGQEHEIDCVDDPNSQPEYIAVYKLIRVEKAK